MSSDEVPTLEEIEERVAFDDHTGVVELGRARLAAHPDDPDAAAHVARSEATLNDIYNQRFGDFSRCPRVTMPGDKMQWLSIDHRAGFLVSRIDGQTSVQDLLEISGMRRLDALRILHDLLQQNVLELLD